MKPALPPSATDVRINLVGLVMMLATTGALLWWRPVDARTGIVLLMAAVAVPIAALDLLVLKVHRRATTGLDWSSPRALDPASIATRWLGAAGAVALPLAVWWLAPEYQGSFYDHLYWFVRLFGVPLAVVGLGALAVTDRYLVDPRDGYWHLGAWLTGRGAQVDSGKIADLFRGWVIKGFFFPLMFTYAVTNLTELGDILGRDAQPPLEKLFDSAWSLLFLVDVVFTSIGYLMTFRLLDTHVRSAQPHAAGWLFALICYQPFYSVISRQYLAFDDGYHWGDLLAPWPVVKVAWGAAILALLCVYASATVAFGVRFSNLTHRGIITGGPYRWLRHPAYVSKCTLWWLVHVPLFTQGDAYAAARGVAWLAALNGVYWIRARTEERHLSSDPTYVAYALAMNERSILAPLGRWLPFLRYRPPAP